MSEEDKLLEQLKDHFPDVLYGMNIHFYHERDVNGPIQTEVGMIGAKTTAFEMCRATIVKDVVDVTDSSPEYLNYYFVVAECTVDYIRISRTITP